MKVLISDPMDKEAIKVLIDAGLDVDERTEKKTPEEVAAMIEPYHAILVRSATKVSQEAIDRGKNLRVIARGGVGLDNIDVDYARSKGIEVLNTPGASSRSVAELAMAHMLAVARHIPQANQSMREGKWEKKNFKGFELGGKTLGLIGFGQIGHTLARLALVIDMEVLAYDPFVDASDLDGVKLVSKDELIQQADIISLHNPFNREQGPTITAREFAFMKKGTVLINCARGGVVDEKALLDALNDGTVACAGIDVFEQEPTQNMELVNHPRVSVTPHIGASTVEAQKRVGMEIAQKVVDALKSA